MKLTTQITVDKAYVFAYHPAVSYALIATGVKRRNNHLTKRKLTHSENRTLRESKVSMLAGLPSIIGTTSLARTRIVGRLWGMSQNNPDEIGRAKVLKALERRLRCQVNQEAD